jgi:hypothetical protein
MNAESPPALRVAILALYIISAIQFLIGVAAGQFPLIVGVVLNIVIALGLRAGHRWAYVVTLIFAFGNPVLLASVGRPGPALIVLLLNGIVAVPVLMSTRYFWPRAESDGQPPARFCPHCGTSLEDSTRPLCPRCGTAHAI